MELFTAYIPPRVHLSRTQSSTLVLQCKKLLIGHDCAAEGIHEVNGAPPHHSGALVASKSDARLLERSRIERAFMAVFKASRQDADLSREEAAEALGLTKNQVVNMENGRRVVTGVDLILLARRIRRDPKELFNRVLNW